MNKTMKEQKIFALSIIVILVALVVGGTSAYFTFSDEAHNVITTSGVAIELIEDTDEMGADGRPVPFVNIDNAMPGDRISKMPKIKNVDEGEVYVRMRVTAHVESADGRSNKISLDAFNPDISRSWSPRDGYYYFMRPLAKDEITNALFTTVTIPKSLTDREQGAKYTINIFGEAVQTANNGTGPLDAQGWPGE